VKSLRIESINISNYRQYVEEKFKFNKKGAHDLHIIIGANGIGKTNLLNAITWCLYEQEPHLAIKSKALPVVNTTCLSSMNIGDTCLVKVEIKAETEEYKVTFNRKANYRKAEDNEPFMLNTKLDAYITKPDGSSIIYEDEEAKSQIKRYLPYGLREFFFFDGEQLDTYFISDKRLRIETPIYEISQVSLINKASEHLTSIITDLNREAGRNNPDLTNLLSEVEESNEEKDTIEKELNECKEQITTSEEIIKKHTEFLLTQPDVEELENKRADYNKKLAIIECEKTRKKLELKSFIREYTVLISAYPNIRKSLGIINDKENKGQLPPNIDKKFLKNMLLEDKCKICLGTLDFEGKNNINKILKELEMTSEASHLLTKLKVSLESIVEKISNYKGCKSKLLTELDSIMKRENDINSQIDKVENQLSVCSDKEKIKDAINERKIHEQLKDSNLEKKGKIQERYNVAIEKSNSAEEKYKKALEKHKGKQAIISNINFAGKAKNIITGIKKELMTEIKDKTRENMQKIFLDLIWKSNTYDEVLLDDSYSLGLLHVDGYECLGSCSAAERSMLALAFTLALHNVSGFDSPLVVDTPVSRVSDVNRTRFANVLKNVSKNKQLILLFTPSEYSSEIESVFNTIYSSKILIDSKDEKSTFIRGDLNG